MQSSKPNDMTGKVETYLTGVGAATVGVALEALFMRICACERENELAHSIVTIKQNSKGSQSPAHLLDAWSKEAQNTDAP